MTERNETTFQHTKDRDQLIQLLRALPLGTSRFNEIQNALLNRGMFFLIDSYTEIKYSLIKTQERLLGGVHVIGTNLGNVNVRATLQDPFVVLVYTLVLLKTPIEDEELSEKGKIYISVDEENKIMCIGIDHTDRKIRRIQNNQRTSHGGMFNG